MGDVLIVYKIYPEEVEDSDRIVEALKSKVPEEFKLNSVELEPIAFGLKIVKASFIFPDKIGGLLEKLEEFLKSVPGVNEIEPASTTLI